MALTIAYCPSTTEVTAEDDNLVYGALNDIRMACEAEICINDGNAKLGRLDTAGGRLYVVGHGNGGSAIGAHHHESAGAHALVQQLLEEGMPKNPKNQILIHLHACATGASVRVAYHFKHKQPYVERFCRALREAGCSNFKVVGYAGFVNNLGRVSTKYNTSDESKRNFNQGSMHKNLKLDDEILVVYEVTTTDYNKIHGSKWKQEVSHPLEGWWPETYYEIHKVP
ncbi:hypothetical protein V8J88_06035 [Massilia sp. W12]|uniref:hypothetical protein n=1 Tax=Massilia sp. W12 TaxID=3126507 RepID=UPI0030D5035D